MSLIWLLTLRMTGILQLEIPREIHSVHCTTMPKYDIANNISAAPPTNFGANFYPMVRKLPIFSYHCVRTW